MELHAMQKTAEISGKNGLIQHAIKTHKTLTRNPYIQIKLTELEREYRQCRIRTLNQPGQKRSKKRPPPITKTIKQNTRNLYNANFLERAQQTKWQPIQRNWICAVKEDCTHENKTLKGIKLHINKDHDQYTIPSKGGTQCPYCLTKYMNLEPLLIHSKLKKPMQIGNPAYVHYNPNTPAKKTSGKHYIAHIATPTNT